MAQKGEHIRAAAQHAAAERPLQATSSGFQACERRKCAPADNLAWSALCRVSNRRWSAARRQPCDTEKERIFSRRLPVARMTRRVQRFLDAHKDKRRGRG
ncbi:uncharacterized protein PHACADRAFT_248914 [Phanerochaete carnosa HHB-10118-sp]|uniref:Uncharacterized protein n=1 Tax=Phanerochaete carnosa (strain HHB-10118-sp) TaxID=650164 RepID=K5WHM7_PHACS|nr:uncharacterized protein PHACADRAFT_248914 [Phanerochaete carnosa HHB-10118-sp]EKM58825.1 hypothetical protein PHACADRAFT_248914 [Phanerochaete carnosa HHB-10118-sp]